MSRNSIAPDVSLSDLNLAGEEVYRIDNLKKIDRVDPPILVHGSDGRLIKMRSFPSETRPRAFVDFLGNAFWPHNAIVLGRYGRAVAVSDNKYHPDQICSAGAALGSLHASMTGAGAGGVR
jgi:hypothetical protein